MELTLADYALKVIDASAKRERYSIDVRVLAFDCSDHFASNEIERGSKVVNDISDDCAKVLWRKHNVQVKRRR
jgi:hypothetical protein